MSCVRLFINSNYDYLLGLANSRQDSTTNTRSIENAMPIDTPLKYSESPTMRNRNPTKKKLKAKYTWSFLY